MTENLCCSAAEKTWKEQCKSRKQKREQKKKLFQIAKNDAQYANEVPKNDHATVTQQEPLQNK
jgi:hypothetical protein